MHLRRAIVVQSYPFFLIISFFKLLSKRIEFYALLILIFFFFFFFFFIRKTSRSIFFFCISHYATFINGRHIVKQQKIKRQGRHVQDSSLILISARVSFENDVFILATLCSSLTTLEEREEIIKNSISWKIRSKCSMCGFKENAMLNWFEKFHSIRSVLWYVE